MNGLRPSRVPTGARLVIAMLGSLVLAVTPVGGGTATAKEAGAEVALRKVRFDPREVVVRAGQAVTWVHKDGRLPHNVVADDGSFNSHPACGRPSGACMKGGDRFTHAFTRPGVFSYY